jgi:dUTP pyrophosphatase
MIHVELVSEDATMPTRATDGSAGLDMYACQSAVIEAGKRTLVDTGVSIAIPHGYVGLIWPRSGLALKKGLDVGAGVIDSDYRNVIGVLLFNHTDDPYRVEPGDRIAQILIQPAVMVQPVQVSSLDHTDRGQAGYGSTGR